MLTLKKYVLFSLTVALTSTLAFGQDTIQDSQLEQERDVTPRVQEDLELDRPAVEQESANSQDQVASYMAGRLLLRNHANIELAGLAAKKSNNKDTKALAKQVIADCQKLNAKLKNLAPQTIVQAIATDQREQWKESVADGTKTQRIKSAKPAMGALVGSNPALFQLSELDRQIAANQLNLAKQHLSKLDAAEFDKHFVEHQAMCCAMTQSEIKTLKSLNSPAFQEIVNKMNGCLTEHLEQINQLKQ